MEKKAGLILGGILLFSLVLVVGFVMAVAVEETSTDATVTVNEFLDITIGGTVPIAFGSNDPGTPDNPAGGAVTITIESVTNVATDTFLKGADWKSPTTLAISNVKYSVHNIVNGSAVNMTTAYAAANAGFFENVDCPCGGSAVEKSVFFYLSIPAGQEAGTYTATIINIKTVKDGTTP